MDVRNCRDCGRLFNYMSGPRICEACRKKLEDKFMEVREYVRDNPTAGVAEVAEANEVSVQQIHQWVREERLLFTEDSMVTLDCEKCGAPIRTGRFCEKCKSHMINELDSVYKKNITLAAKRVHDGEKMRYLDK